ncbi:hypothetical protein Q31a_26710 [Aureliella helgolandensis]|uniref:Uncharacterized protein n=1 Tax=Aureliella helgolandensis TaxID=2527968 RepID=A0A518G6Z2_9BACT|nr:hypothetical protein Q31a_26710 [Aureliella helgolandensis]
MARLLGGASETITIVALAKFSKVTDSGSGLGTVYRFR